MTLFGPEYESRSALPHRADGPSPAWWAARRAWARARAVSPALSQSARIRTAAVCRPGYM